MSTTPKVFVQQVQLSQCHLVDVDWQSQGQNDRDKDCRIDPLRRKRLWAAGFQSGNAATDAVHALYYNTQALGNHLGELPSADLVWTRSLMF
jgi:hypothetical protein